MLIVGDVGGQFDAFLRLTRNHRCGVLLADLNDRGPKSRQMIEWAIENQDQWKTLDSNHGDMLVDFFDGIRVYHPHDFLKNGGYATLCSYGMPPARGPELDVRECLQWAKQLIPKEHIEFLRSRPTCAVFEDCLMSHAPAPHPNFWDPKIFDPSPRMNYFDSMRVRWIWNRRNPEPVDGFWQVFGHNSSPPRPFEEPHIWGLTVDEEKRIVCLDDSRMDRLTAMEWPSRKVFQEPFELASRPPEATL